MVVIQQYDEGKKLIFGKIDEGQRECGGNISYMR